MDAAAKLNEGLSALANLNIPPSIELGLSIAAWAVCSRQLRDSQVLLCDADAGVFIHSFAGRQLGSAVFISDLATGFPKLHEWIRSQVIESGHGSLDEGHWPTATEGQRAAAIEPLGSGRFLIRV